MQFGAMNFPVVPVLDEIETFARMGFDYLELAMDPPMAHHRILAAERQAIVQKLRDSHMALVCHLPTFVTTADLTDSLREASVMEMHRSLEVASALGARKVVLHPSMASGLGVFVLETVKAYAFDFLSAIVTAADRLGMTLCLEPMLNIGGWRTRVAGDGWTVLTADGSLSAHFEHTIAITDGDAEMLTRIS